MATQEIASPAAVRTLYGTLGPFSSFVQSPPVIPTFYYDVYSQEQRIKAICQNFARLVAYVEEGFAGVKDVDDEVQAQLNAFRISMEQSLNDLRDELVKIIAGATGSFTTTDPTDEYLTKDAGQVISNVYDFDRELSMSAARFDAANITPAMFDATGMSARHFDTAAAAWLYNPTTAETISEDDGENDGLSVMHKIAVNASGVEASKSAAASAERAAAAQTAAQSAASSATASETAAKEAQEAAQSSASAAQESASAAQESAENIINNNVVFNYRGNLSNADDISDTGIYSMNAATANMPSGVGYSLAIAFKQYAAPNANIAVYLTNPNNGNTYFRFRNNLIWSAWFSI